MNVLFRAARFAALATGFGVVLCGAAAQAAPDQSVAVAAVHEACCGVITANGNRLAELIDSMNVEKLWQAHAHVDWETGEEDRPTDYVGPGRATHCSAFAAAVGERLHVYMLRPPDHSQIFLASAQARWFESKKGANGGWHPLEGPRHEQRAQELANQGSLVVIVYENPDPHRPGHIVIVRPSEKSAEALRREGPQIAEAGTRNYDSTVAADAFVHHAGAWPDGVHYYWHPVNWGSLAVEGGSAQ
jgi:hypothetical protein